MLLLGHGLAADGKAVNGSQVFAVSMLIILRFINLTVALAAGSARVTGLGANAYIILYGTFFCTPPVCVYIY